MKAAHFALLILAAAALLAGCGSSDSGSSTDADTGAGTDTGTDTGTDSYTDAALDGDLGARAFNTTAKAALLAQAFIAVPPSATRKKTIEADSPSWSVINPAAYDFVNAQAIVGAIEGAVENNTCATIAYTEGQATLTAVLAADCPVVTAGLKASGTISVTVSETQGSATVAFTFTDFVIDGGDPLAGSVTLVYSGDGTFTLSISLDAGGTVYAFDGTLVRTDQTVVLDGTGSITKSGATTEATFTGLTWTVGDCYPSGGSITFGSGPLAKTMTFNADSAMTGVVEVKVGRLTESVTLAAYGDCPMEM